MREMIFRKKKEPPKYRERVLCSKRSINDRTARGVEVLDRANNQCANCDNKASIVLTLVGVMLTALLAEDGNSVYYSYFEKTFVFNERSLFLSIPVGCIVGVALCMLRVLLARVECSESGSVVFFADVAKYNSSKDYLDRLREINDEEYWIDLESQVYQVSKLAKRKYRCFNLGMKLLLFGSVYSGVALSVYVVCHFIVT